MTAPFPGAGAGTHYDNTSVKEDVSEIIYQITPTDKPFYTMTGDTGGKINHEWQKRSLSTRNDNANPEGFTYSFTAQSTTPSRVVNTAQIFKKEVRISESEQAEDHYGIGDMYGDQLQIRLTEMGTDMEHALLRGTMATGNATDGSRRMDGIMQALASNQTTYTLVSLVSMSEVHFNNFLQVAWDEGGAPRDVLVGGYMKRKISGFTAGGTKFVDTTAQALVNTISMYDSDFFPVQIHLSRDIPKLGDTVTVAASLWSGFDALFVDRTMCAKAWHRRPTTERTAKIADSNDGVVKAELSLEYGNPNAHFLLKQTL